MKREFLEENNNTLSKSSDFGRVLFYMLRECCFILESAFFSLLVLC